MMEAAEFVEFVVNEYNFRIRIGNTPDQALEYVKGMGLHVRSPNEHYDDGFSAGRDDGYTDGWDDGYSEGYETGSMEVET